MKYIALVLISLLLAITTSCLDDSENAINSGTPTSPSGDAEWLVPSDQVLDGGPGLDGIPSIDAPEFTIATEVDFLDTTELVLGIRVGDEVRAYPHNILDYHEIVNDDIAGKPIALTYCPLTGTGIGWDRRIGGSTTTFGVSGLLYNSNLMPYDRASGSVWSQQRLQCVNGDNAGQKPSLHVFVESSWGTWRKMYPNSMVLNTNTGTNRDYSRYPYGTYKTNSSLLFPVSESDPALDAKERVLGVFVGDEVKVYPFATSEDGIIKDTTIVIADSYEGSELVIVQNAVLNFNVAFEAISGSSYSALDSKSFPAVIQDSEGFTYDILGNGVSDPGRSLILATQFMGYWFSWAAFYPDLDLYDL